MKSRDHTIKGHSTLWVGDSSGVKSLVTIGIMIVDFSVLNLWRDLAVGLMEVEI